MVNQNTFVEPKFPVDVLNELYRMKNYYKHVAVFSVYQTIWQVRLSESHEFQWPTISVVGSTIEEAVYNAIQRLKKVGAYS